MSDLPSIADRPTRVRLSVLALLCTLSFVLYMDRVCMSQAITPIKAEFGLDDVQISYVLNAFLVAYALFEIPTGRWGDRFGSRRVLARIVIWWSVFTMLTGASSGLLSLVAVRFMFGAGEAGAYPNAARIIRGWFPKQERGRVQGMMLASAGVGAVLAQVLSGYLIRWIGWRWTFFVFGTAGLLWVAAFLRCFRETPAEQASVNDAELALIGHADAEQCATPHTAVPWRAVARSLNIWLLGAITASGAFCAYLYYSWYPTYMKEGRGVSTEEAGWISGSILAGGVIGQLASGFIADWMVHHCRHLSRARRHFGFSTYFLAAGLLIAGIQNSSPWITAAFTSASCLVMFLPIATWWGVVTEISGRHLGALFGLLNAMGVLGGLASQYFFGALSNSRRLQGYTGREQWDPAFYAYATVLGLAAVCWLFVDSGKRIGPECKG